MQRRQFLALCSLVPAFRTWARDVLVPTPGQSEGPFYPVAEIPQRSDLILHESGLTGKPIGLFGRVVNPAGQPLPGVTVEIWQCDGAGIYQHPGQSGVEHFDPHFAGFGAVKTDMAGQYRFRTIYPVPYGSRPPHIHVKLWQGSRELLTTQLYLQGQTGNEWWGGDRKLLQFELAKQNGMLTGQFDFVLTV